MHPSIILLREQSVRVWSPAPQIPLKYFSLFGNNASRRNQKRKKITHTCLANILLSSMEQLRFFRHAGSPAQECLLNTDRTRRPCALSRVAHERLASFFVAILQNFYVCTFCVAVFSRRICAQWTATGPRNMGGVVCCSLHCVIFSKKAILYFFSFSFGLIALLACVMPLLTVKGFLRMTEVCRVVGILFRQCVIVQSGSMKCWKFGKIQVRSISDSKSFCVHMSIILGCLLIKSARAAQQARWRELAYGDPYRLTFPHPFREDIERMREFDVPYEDRFVSPFRRKEENQ